MPPTFDSMPITSQPKKMLSSRYIIELVAGTGDKRFLSQIRRRTTVRHAEFLFLSLSYLLHAVRPLRRWRVSAIAAKSSYYSMASEGAWMNFETRPISPTENAADTHWLCTLLPMSHRRIVYMLWTGKLPDLSTDAWPRNLAFDVASHIADGCRL